MNKLFPSAAAALDGIVRDGQLLAVGGFGLCGIPEALIDALREIANEDYRGNRPHSAWVALDTLKKIGVEP